jgi:protein-S-isoprenylcysteine O-methyltransferase Ste14
LSFSPLSAANLLFILWALSWILAAFWSSRARSRAGIIEQLPYRLITIAGFFLLFGVRPGRSYRYLVLWSLPGWLGWILTALTAVGFAFAWWARLYLGKLWSGFVTTKEQHRIINTGPYGIVRHPIYTGIILAVVSVGILKGNVFTIAGALFIAVGFWIKARLEERFLRQQLGADTYEGYRRRVPMIIPRFTR